jgi:hypothetical protein
LQASATLLLRRVPKSVTFPGSNLRDLRIAANGDERRHNRSPPAILHPRLALASRSSPSGAAQPATNALDRVVEPDWIEPGTLVACVKAHELGHEILTGADRIILHARDLNPINYVTGYGPEPFRDTDFVDMLFNEKRGGGDVRNPRPPCPY